VKEGGPAPLFHSFFSFTIKDDFDGDLS